MIFNGDKVLKKGRIMGIIIGCLVDNSFLFWINKFFLLKGCFCFYNCYVIENYIVDKFFFEFGDFGFGVYVMENENILKLLGLVFVNLCFYIVVCKID